MYKPSPAAMRKMMAVKPQGENYEAHSRTHAASSDDESSKPKARTMASASSSVSSTSGPAGLFADKKDAKPMPMNARRTVPLPAFTKREKKPRSATMLRRTGKETSQFSTDDVMSIDAVRSNPSMQSVEEENDSLSFLT